jgi:hypothetical protein
MPTKKRHSRRISALPASASLLLALLAGCASQVEVQADFPTPLIEPLPVSVGIVMDEALTEYEHFEEIPDQITWTIRLGSANRTMLEQLLASLFATTVAVDALPTPESRSSLDGVIKPELEKFEFEVPVRGRDNFAEVWMQYRLKLYEPDGDLVADWPVSGYGKSEIHRSGREDSLTQAAIVAMREVGAAIATQFPAQPQVEYWVQQRQNQIPSEIPSAGSGFLISNDETSLPNQLTPTGQDDD